MAARSGDSQGHYRTLRNRNFRQRRKSPPNRQSQTRITMGMHESPIIFFASENRRNYCAEFALWRISSHRVYSLYSRPACQPPPAAANRPPPDSRCMHIRAVYFRECENDVTDNGESTCVNNSSLAVIHSIHGLHNRRQSSRPRHPIQPPFTTLSQLCQGTPPIAPRSRLSVPLVYRCARTRFYSLNSAKNYQDLGAVRWEAQRAARQR